MKEIFLDSLFTFISNSISRLSFIILSIVTAKVLISEDFHSFTIMMSTLNMIVSSIGFAVGITIVKSAVEYHNNKTKKKEREYFSFIKLFIIGSLVVFIGVSFLYNLISKLLFNGKVYFALAFLTLTILALYYTVSSYFLIGVKDFKSLSKYNLLIGTVFILSLLMVMYTDLSYNSLYTITLLLASFYFTGILLCVRKYAQLIPGFNRIEFKLHSTDENYFKKITLPAFLSNLVYAFTVWLQIIIVGYLLNDRNMASEVATGLIWFNALAFIPQTISTVILPRISSENKNKLKILKVGMLINVCSTCILISFLTLTKSQINELYSSQFEQLADLILIMSFASLPNACCKVTGQYFIASSKMNISLMFNSLWAIVYIFTNVILLKFGFGVFSVGYALIISYSILFFSQYVFIRVSETNELCNSN